MGPQGIQGERGIDGINGKDGAPGRDGNIENLYPRQVDARTWHVCYRDSQEPVPGWVLKFPGLPKWRELFKADVDYEAGDLVRWGGTVYIAKNDGAGITPGDKSPMSSVMWDVFSERGRQGKTGDKGERGDMGPRGEKGERGPERW